MKGRKYEQYSNNLEGLKALDTGQLQALWAEIFKGQRNPQSDELVIRKIAYFLQERGQDRLSVRVQNQVRRLAEDPMIHPRNRYVLESNHQLVREWNGKKYSVAVLDNNKFRYDGRIYKTLTAIAREITGAHWSGPLFFGLRKHMRGKGR